MKKIVAFLCFLALALAPCSFLGAQVVSETLTGEYLWNRQEDSPGPIEAVFTPTGENEWDVAFHFEFRGEDHVWKGTAEGSLTDGALSGVVMSGGDEPRPFTFSGEFEDGVFEGTHQSERDGETHQTGTITLKR